MKNLVLGNAKPINLLNCPSYLLYECELGLPIFIYPEEATEQVGEEDEAMRKHGTGDMEEFREDGLDGPRTADDQQDCFNKFIVVRALKTKSAEVCEHITSSRQLMEVNLLLTCWIRHCAMAAACTSYS